MTKATTRGAVGLLAAVAAVLVIGCAQDEGSQVVSGPMLEPNFTLVYQPIAGVARHPGQWNFCKDGSSAAINLTVDWGEGSESIDVNFPVWDSHQQRWLRCVRVGGIGAHLPADFILTEDLDQLPDGFTLEKIVVTIFRRDADGNLYEEGPFDFFENPLVLEDVTTQMGFLAEFKNVPGGDGCTPGAWKNRLLKIGEWDKTGYSPSQTVGSVFSAAAAFPSLASATLLEALEFEGGPTLADKAALLIHHGVAAVLNAADPDIAYAMSEADVIAQVNAALSSGDADTMLDLKDQLDWYNNQRCFDD